MKKQAASGLLALITLFIALTCMARAHDSSQEMASAKLLMENGLYLEAVGAFQEIVDNVDDADIRALAVLSIANVYSYYLGDYDIALKKYWLIKKHFSHTSSLENAIFNSGMIYFEKKQYREAVYNFREYLKRYPQGTHRETAVFMISACAKTDDSGTGLKGNKYERVSAALPATDVRVLLLSGVQAVRVTSEKPFAIGGGGNDNFKSATFYDEGGYLKADCTSLAASKIVINPPEGAFLEVNGIPYRGRLRIVTNANKQLLVINDVILEEYLQGVVPKEMSPQWPIEALKAQAVAARSFVLYQKDKNRKKDYDVSASTNSQVYGGVGAESPVANRAIKETSGKILTYKGLPILAYFHANSGGMTEDAKSAWTTDVPYLRSVKDEYSSIAPNLLWEQSFSLEAISQTLSKNGVDVGAIEKLEISGTSSSGRVVKIRITGQRGRTVLHANDFRMKMGASLIKSTLFKISSNGKTVTFKGRGSGHGVGMSQWGAYIMARHGLSFTDILRHYYSGADLI